jgi:hypothetical protein
MRRTIAAVLVAIAAFVVLMPVACTTGEGEPSARCETLGGWSLPGFEGASTGWTAYVVPLVVAVVVFVVVRWRWRSPIP